MRRLGAPGCWDRVLAAGSLGVDHNLRPVLKRLGVQYVQRAEDIPAPASPPR